MQRDRTRTGQHWTHVTLLVVAVLVVNVRADFDLTILHTNDVHARIEETDKNSGPCTPDLRAAHGCFGGAARIRAKVLEKRQQFPNRTLLLDAGDQFQGTLWFYVFGGLVSSEFMNLIGYDAMAIGNHEFDTGIEGLSPFAHNLTFPILSSNMDVTGTALADVVKKSVILEVGGQKIGVVGYTTTETPYISSPGKVTFGQELQAVQGEIDKLTAQNIDKIIVLGHSGFQIDLELAEKLKNVDVVIGGHTNTFLFNGTKPSTEQPLGLYPTIVKNQHNGHPVPVVQDYAYGKYLGELHLTFNDRGEVIRWWGNPILLDNSVPQDNATMNLIQKYLPELSATKTTVIGSTNVELKANRTTCRTTECVLGNLIADAFVSSNLRLTDPDSWTDAGIAVVNSGSFRASIDKGPITMEEVIFVQPFRNPIGIMDISGQTLLDMLEFGASKWTENPDDAFGGFLQVSGLQITYDINQPVNRRVVEVLAVCTKCPVPKLEPLLPDKTYRILASSFIINGGDGYSMLPGKILKQFDVGTIDTDLVMDYVKKFSPIHLGLQGRIRHRLDTTCKSNAALAPLPTMATFVYSIVMSLLVIKYGLNSFSLDKLS